MKMRKKVMAVAAVFAAFVIGANAATTPFELSLFGTPISIPWCDDVSGLRLNILSGWNKNVSGLDIGTLANIVEEKSAGLQLCGFYNHVGEGRGNFQLAGLMNRCDRDYKGLQLSAVYNEVGDTMSGAALAAMNMSKELHGLQIGIFNSADVLSGMQLGVVNYAENADNGVQVGIVNVMPNGNIPVSVIVNIGF